MGWRPGCAVMLPLKERARWHRYAVRRTIRVAQGYVLHRQQQCRRERCKLGHENSDLPMSCVVYCGPDRRRLSQLATALPDGPECRYDDACGRLAAPAGAACFSRRFAASCGPIARAIRVWQRLGVARRVSREGPRPWRLPRVTRPRPPDRSERRPGAPKLRSASVAQAALRPTGRSTVTSSLRLAKRDGLSPLPRRRLGYTGQRSSTGELYIRSLATP